MEYEVRAYHIEGNGERKYENVKQGDLNEIVSYLYHGQKVTASSNLIAGICHKRKSPLVTTIQALTEKQLEQIKKALRKEATPSLPEHFLELIPKK